MNTAFVYMLHACAATAPKPTVVVDMFECKYTKQRICYISSMFEDWRPDSKAFPKEALRGPLGNWPGEKIVDTDNAKVREIMKARMDKAKSKGCDGIDWDNIDQAKNPSDWFKWLSTETRKRGLKVGLKNLAEKAKALTGYADFHVAEECTKYKECGKYPADKTLFIEYMKRSDAVCKARPNTMFADMALKKWEFCR